jgi:predicted O-methyltransferase YrrM
MEEYPMITENDLEIYDNTSSEVQVHELLYGLVRLLRPALVVETGSYYGYAAYALGQACLMNNRGRVITCEINEDLARRARIKCTGLPVEVRHAHVIGGLPELAEADLVFSDSDFALRPKEYELVKPGCVFVMHDTRMSFTAGLPATHLGDFIHSVGGICFEAGRGLGIAVKPRL